MLKETSTLTNRLKYVAASDSDVVVKGDIDKAADDLFKFMNDRFTFSNDEEFIKIVGELFANPESKYMLAFEKGLEKISNDSTASEKSFALDHLLDNHRKYTNDLIAVIAARHLMNRAKIPVRESNEFKIFLSRLTYVVIEASTYHNEKLI